jgi:hypothetical protein
MVAAREATSGRQAAVARRRSITALVMLLLGCAALVALLGHRWDSLHCSALVSTHSVAPTLRVLCIR